MSWYRWELREYPGRRRRWVAAQTDDHQLAQSVGGRRPRAKSFRAQDDAMMYLSKMRAKDKRRDRRRIDRDEYRVIR